MFNRSCDIGCVSDGFNILSTYLENSITIYDYRVKISSHVIWLQRQKSLQTRNNPHFNFLTKKYNFVDWGICPFDLF